MMDWIHTATTFLESMIICFCLCLILCIYDFHHVALLSSIGLLHYDICVGNSGIPHPFCSCIFILFFFLFNTSQDSDLSAVI